MLPRLGNSAHLETDPSEWDFTSLELKEVASTLNNGKAFGWDHVPSEFIKNAPNFAFSVIASLFNKIKNTGILPNGWNC